VPWREGASAKAESKNSKRMQGNTGARATARRTSTPGHSVAREAVPGTPETESGRAAGNARTAGQRGGCRGSTARKEPRERAPGSGAAGRGAARDGKSGGAGRPRATGDRGRPEPGPGGQTKQRAAQAIQEKQAAHPVAARGLPTAPTGAKAVERGTARERAPSHPGQASARVTVRRRPGGVEERAAGPVLASKRSELPSAASGTASRETKGRHRGAAGTALEQRASRGAVHAASG